MESLLMILFMDLSCNPAMVPPHPRRSFTMWALLKLESGVVLLEAAIESNKGSAHGFTVWRVSCLSLMVEQERLGDVRQEIPLLYRKDGTDTWMWWRVQSNYSPWPSSSCGRDLMTWRNDNLDLYWQRMETGSDVTALDSERIWICQYYTRPFSNIIGVR
mmetsp:Transcript_5569/g.13116  ORF Transcript_5569/g.13116 Transcript_5569/m.13116 type:complete len:160 (+) Transcript_5569:781-1260(+)